MNYSSFFRTTSILFLSLIVFIIFSFSTIISVLSSSNEIKILEGKIVDSENIIFNFSNSSFLWPTPNYTTITSHFGKRSAPTSGASSYHSGIDIGAPKRYKYFSNIFWHCNLCRF